MNDSNLPINSDSEETLPQNPPSTKVFLSPSEKEDTLLQLLSQQKKTVPSQSTLHSSVRGSNTTILMANMGSLFSQERYKLLETLTKKDSELCQLLRDIWLDRNVLQKQVQGNIHDKNIRVALDRIRREARITGCLEHPYIVPLHDMQQEKNGSVFFTLRTMRGERLSEFFQKKRQHEEFLDESFFLGSFLKVCDAIAYAHSKSIVHRSLTPSNLWIGSFGEVYVSDWSSAKYIEEKGHPAEDIGALGKILREGFLGISPETEAEMMNTSRDQRKLKQAIRERIPLDLQWIIYKATDDDWNKRYASLQEFVADIERYQKNLRISSRKYTREEILSKWMQRNRRILQVSCFLFVVLFFLLVYFRWVRIEEQKRVFQSICTQARQHILSSQQMTDSSLATSLRLRAFHQFRVALSMDADPRIEKERYEIGRMILEQAYQNQDYILAQYMAQELGTISFLTEDEKKRLAEEVLRKQKFIQEEHLKKLEEWLRILKNSRQTDALRKEALIEIFKMKEPEVVLILKQHHEEGKKYAISNERHPRLDEFYETIQFLLNHLESSRSLK